MQSNDAMLKFLLVIRYLLAGIGAVVLYFVNFCSRIFFSFFNGHFVFSFVPPDDFKLALLTLELEFVKGKSSRTEEVCLSLEIHV